MEHGWPLIRDQLQEVMPKGQFDLWVATLEFLGMKDQRLVLGCRNQLHVEWLRGKLEQRLLQLARQYFPHTVSLDYRVVSTDASESTQDSDSPAPGYHQMEFQEVLAN